MLKVSASAPEDEPRAFLSLTLASLIATCFCNVNKHAADELKLSNSPSSVAFIYVAFTFLVDMCALFIYYARTFVRCKTMLHCNHSNRLKYQCKKEPSNVKKLQPSFKESTQRFKSKSCSDIQVKH